ncbi:MAG: hypothetical protein H0W85_04950 [Methylotenera sp.]|nr:hypothetical protein [Methylotenera sp.]
MKNIFQNIITNVFNDIPRKHAVWLEAIEDQDDLLALQSATLGLESVLADTALPVSTISQIIDEATIKTRPTLRKINQQFVKFEYMDSNIENNILGVVYGFHRQLYNSYLTLLDDFMANPVKYETGTIHALLSEIVAQIFEMLKWRSFVNLGLAPKVWLQLHMIYGLANDNGLLDKVIKSEDSLPSPTLNAKLVQTYMLDSLQQANLSRQGIDIICKILQRQLLDVEISPDFNPVKFLFYVDLDKDSGAKRIRHFTPTNSCIYWQIDALEKEIAIMIDRVNDNVGLTMLTSSLSIEPYQFKAIPDTLNAVMQEWSRKEYRRQRRKEDRQKLSTTASVMYGIQNVCERVKVHENKKLRHGARFSADGRSLDERLRNHAIIKGEENKLKVDQNNHHWVIVDESNRGLGAVAAAELNPWISVGQLIGLVKADSQQNMIVAIIRSAKPKANRQIQVGIEILSRHAKWIQLKLTSPATNSDSIAQLANARTFPGLYLPMEAGLSTNSSLMLPKIEFVAQTSYEISIAGIIENIILNTPIDSKDDWVKLIYPS